jgi:4-alpha-glucanotransferase
VPLFSCPSSTSWGIGEIADLEPMTAWLADAGMRVLQLLPVNEMAPGQQSPYSAISAMAIDPIFIRLPGSADFEALGGECAIGAEDRARLDAVRRASRVEHAEVRRLKSAWLRASFDRFLEAEWRADSPRAADLRAFLDEQAWWVADYGLFRAIHAREQERPWTEWPDGIRDREPGAMERVRRELADEVLFAQYLQWEADRQWKAARQHTHGVELFGDLPFMVDLDSADVWTRRDQFELNVTIGAPPDAFSAEGQDWGTPLYRWDVIARDDFRWLRERARRCAALFDGYRIDHLVGFFRTYGRPHDGRAPFFTPAHEHEQRALGETILSAFKEPGSEIVAEDLGTVPDFVRESLANQRIPGFKVLRWERHWHTDGQPFRRPSEYPQLAVAASGTHDTEPMATWWEQASDDERRKVSEALSLDLSGAPYHVVRDALVTALLSSPSDLVLLPIQDVFGWRDRINDPAVVADTNWVYRLPWPCDRPDPSARETQERLRAWVSAYAR